MLERHARSALKCSQVYEKKPKGKSPEDEQERLEYERWERMQERGYAASAKIVALIQAGKMADAGWDRKCDRLAKFFDEFVHLEPEEFERRVIIERANKVITEGGMELARRLYGQYRRGTSQSTHIEGSEAAATAEDSDAVE